LSKVSALWVAARNTAFTFKGKHVDVAQVARQLKVGHVLEGSVRKAGGRVRITAQLIDGATGGHVWAERYDRDLNDIFALQDEIAHAIVNALKLQLLPAERQAIEKRGTDNVEAYNLYLMARQNYVTGTEGDAHRAEAIIRLCARATEIDQNYAHAWALLGLGHVILRYVRGGSAEPGMSAADRALALDPNLAEAHSIKARIYSEAGQFDEASVEIDRALQLDPESYEVNRSAAYLNYRQNHMRDAIHYFEKAKTILGSDVNSANMLTSCYMAIGDRDAALRTARYMLETTERTLAQDPSNASALAYGASALSFLGEPVRAREWMQRALLLDPDNLKMRYNFACDLVTKYHEPETALEVLVTVFEKIAHGMLNLAKTDPDFDALRDDPRFKAMIAAAEARLAAEDR
jgi:adenylate cyclase